MIKRMSISLMTVALIAMLVSGATFALFTASTTNTDNTFTAGTVTLGTPALSFITLDNIAPGDSGTVGTYAITYSGSLDAWIGLTTSTSGDLFGGLTPLTVTITDNNSNTYLANQADQVVGQVTNNTTTTFTVNYAMPLAANNDYQGDSGTLSMSVKAVQARNNTNTSGTGPISWN
ncbi:MAG: TasA family protein [Bacillota bacterium]